MKKIYYNGNFITLENNEIEALLIEDGIIKKTGNKQEILNCQDDKTEIIDLKGKTMMPSFIDAHSHFSGVANNFLKVNLEGCKNFKEIQEKLLSYKKENNIKDNEWIIASGYDNNSLEEKNILGKTYWMIYYLITLWYCSISQVMLEYLIVKH